MEIHVSASGSEPTLVDPDDFKGFKVVLRDDPPSRAAALEAAGAVKHEEHVWISVTGLRRLAGDAATPEWESGLQAMVGFAVKHGFFDEASDSIRAHVEHA